jgi:hypothetical protein
VCRLEKLEGEGREEVETDERDMGIVSRCSASSATAL